MLDRVDRPVIAVRVETTEVQQATTVRVWDTVADLGETSPLVVVGELLDDALTIGETLLGDPFQAKVASRVIGPQPTESAVDVFAGDTVQVVVLERGDITQRISSLPSLPCCWSPPLRGSASPCSTGTVRTWPPVLTSSPLHRLHQRGKRQSRRHRLLQKRLQKRARLQTLTRRVSKSWHAASCRSNCNSTA